MRTYTDIAARARALHAAGALPTRQWTLPVICDHLAKAMIGSTGVLGPGAATGKSTPPYRRIAGRILVLHLGFIPSGVPSPQRIIPQPDVTWDEAISRLDEAIMLCQAQSQTARQWIAHPLMGFSDPKRWQRFHLVHARHHFRCLRAGAV